MREAIPLMPIGDIGDAVFPGKRGPYTARGIEHGAVWRPVLLGGACYTSVKWPWLD